MEARTRRRATHPISHYWGLVKDLDDSQKLQLVTMLVISKTAQNFGMSYETTTISARHKHLRILAA